MTDKQINIVEILAEQCKNCTLYEGDTVSLNISIFDRPLRGVCFNNNIYFSVDELNYIMQKIISKEQECEELKKKVYKYEQAEKYPAAFLWQEGLL